MSVSNNLRKTRDNLKAFLKSNQVWQTNENLDALDSCATKSVISSFCVNWTFSPSKLQRGINGESGGWKMTNEWALYSSVCSLLPLTHLLCPSCLGVLLSLQRAEIKSSKKAGQQRKEISWQFRGISHGLQGGGRDWTSVRDSGAGLFGNSSSSPIPISASLSMPLFSIWSFSHGSKIPRKGTSWLVLVD